MRAYFLLPAALIVFVVLISGCTQEGEDTGGHAPNVSDLCQKLCLELKENGMPLEDGPCISDINWTKWNIDGWVCDVAHSPRQDVDNLPENQCETFRSGRAHHFVEVDAECNIIRAV